MPYLLTELSEDVTSVTTRSASTHDPSCRVCDFLRISHLVYLPTSTSASMTRPCSILFPNVSNTSVLSLPHLTPLVLATSSLKNPTQWTIVLTVNRFHKHRYLTHWSATVDADYLKVAGLLPYSSSKQLS